MGTMTIDIQRETTGATVVQSNRDAAVEFLRMVVSGRIRDAYARYVDADAFVHHNPGFEGSAAALMQGMEDNPGEVTLFDIKQSVAEGDLVAIHSHARKSQTDPGLATVHIFRFRNGKVIELWDVVQELPAASPNQHGAF